MNKQNHPSLADGFFISYFWSMRTFLSQVLEDALENGSDPKSYCFVLPNKRSSLFLRQDLRTRLVPNSFFPEILSIEEFMERLSGFRVIDNVALLFEFYTVYKNVIPNNESNSFESFSKWAPILLQDFNELDSAMAEAESLLKYIYEAKRIENWDVGDSEPGNLVENYISFHKLIPVLYKSFENHMNDSKSGYQGFVYRKASELTRENVSGLKSMKYVFAGFNALSKSEELVIQHFLDQGNASIYWDDDDFYEKSEASSLVFLFASFVRVFVFILLLVLTVLFIFSAILYLEHSFLDLSVLFTSFRFVI